QELERDDENKNPKPPVWAGALHEPEDAEKKRHADDETEREALETVGDIDRERRLVEAEALFEDEGGIEARRQTRAAEDHPKGDQRLVDRGPAAEASASERVVNRLRVLLARHRAVEEGGNLRR